MDPAPDQTVFAPRVAATTDLFQTGDVVGQYRVEKVLGAGGMGVVYKVQHTALKKEFALKALPAVLAQEASFVKRFKGEATNLAKLRHNNIVNVTDFGESQGRLYLVLEFVPGGTLEEWFEKNRKAESGAPPAEVQRLIGQVLQGLIHAHEAGIIHRDLKPANVLLEKTGEAKISDFGLARAVSEEEYRRSGGTASPFQGDSVTTTGSIVGTIDFMSPEARNMKASDARSDIYAVGVMAYYLLTGKKPHGRAKAVVELVPGLDPRWDKFIETCLEEDPTKRYQTSALAFEGLQLLKQPGGSKKGLWVAVIAVIVVAGVGIAFWQSKASPLAAQKTVPNAVVTASQNPAPGKTLPEPAKQVPEAPTNRKFVLTSLPAGAVVYYHGNHPAGAAGRVVLDLPPGPQVVRVKAPGFIDWEGEIGGVENEREGTVPLEQVPSHPVRFTGLPAQAQLKIDGVMVVADSSGAAVMPLRPGRVTLNLSAAKYESLEQSVEIAQSTESIPLQMKRLPPPSEVLVKLPKGIALKFKWVPAGTFYAGSSPDERGRQSTDLARAKKEIEKGFYIADTEMTQRQHRALTGKNPSTSRALGDESRPVEQVAWRDLAGTGGVLDKANEALRRLDLPYKADLPTEVEWEYACRAGSDSAFNNGSQLTNERDDPALNTLGFYSRGGSPDAPSPVAKYKPNAWGLYDMHGNVAEWAYGVRGARDPVVRGGNWKVGPVHCRSSSRVELTPETRSTDTMGYRLVLRPTEE